MITENRKWRMIFMLFSLACLIAMGVCVICDLTICKGITWSAFVLGAVPFAWIIMSPLMLAKRMKIFYSLTALTVACIPFLWLLNRLTPGGDWFIALGVPLGILGIAAVWLTWIMIKFVKINKWYLSAALVFLYGVVVSMVTKFFVNAYAGGTFFSLDNIINLFSCTVITVLLAIIGYGKKTEKV